jgi:hypothetical protein
MKKLYSESKYKQLTRRRQEKDLARIKRRKEIVHLLNAARRSYRKGLPRQRGGFRPYSKREVLVAPENFSFINNTEVLIKFFNDMERLFKKGHDVFIDFSGIKQLTPDSLAVLVSKIKDDNFNRGMSVGGNEPEDEHLKEQFVRSGFYSVVVPQSRSKEPATGSFRQKRSKKVEPETADDLINFITKKLYGKYRKSGGVTNALLESMSNTRGHAAGEGSPHERWWATAHCDTKAKKAYYSFVDNGVGIFRSKKPHILAGALKLLGIQTNGELLEKMLHRQIPSRTKIPYRGRGVPSIYNSLMRGDIENLIIITNDVYAKVRQDEYRRLSRPFSGTFLYWEYPGEKSDGKGKVKRA